LCIVVSPQTLPTDFKDLWRSSCRLFRKYRRYNDRVIVDAVDDPPLMANVSYAQLVTVASNTRHRTRLRHRQPLASLETA